MEPQDTLLDDEQRMLADAVLFERILVFTCGFAVGGLAVTWAFFLGVLHV